MDKKLIKEDIRRMRFMFDYQPGKVISEQKVQPLEPEVLPKPKERESEPSRPFEDDPLRPGRRTRPRPAPQAKLREDETEVCECGGGIYEGECSECGKSYNINEYDDEFEDEEDFGYASHSGDFDDEEINEDDLSWLDDEELDDDDEY